VTDQLRVVLASASPIRYTTLRSAGVLPTVEVSGVDESSVSAATSDGVALELAQRKARTVAARVRPPALVVGCDSVLDIDGKGYGRPSSAADAAARWRVMRGRSGVLVTGHCVIAVASLGQREVTDVARTVVYFADVSDDEIDAYVASGEPLDVAGAFTLEGLGGAFIERIDGDPHNVMGLSVPLLRRLVSALGIRWIDLWDRSRHAEPARDADQDRG
jgi:septum formation protein